MTGAILVALLTKRTSYKAIMLIGPVSQLIGFFIYGFSSSGWMVILARYLIGVNYGSTVSASMSYYTVSSIEFNELAESSNKKPKPRLKKQLMLTFSAVAAFGYILATGSDL